MASVLHGSARTTPRTRAELQASKESARSLAACYDLNPKTVREVAPADHDGRCADGTKGSEEHGAKADLIFPKKCPSKIPQSVGWVISR